MIAIMQTTRRRPLALLRPTSSGSGYDTRSEFRTSARCGAKSTPRSARLPSTSPTAGSVDLRSVGPEELPDSHKSNTLPTPKPERSAKPRKSRGPEEPLSEIDPAWTA